MSNAQVVAYRDFTAQPDARAPDHWTVVPQLIWDVATFLDHRGVVAMSMVNGIFREALDDSVWQVLSRMQGLRVPRPFPSFKLYYRCAVLQHTPAVTRALFDELPRNVVREGNVIRNTVTLGIETSLPVVRLQLAQQCTIMMLDRAEQVFLGVAAPTAPKSTSRVEIPNQLRLFPIGFALPGQIITLKMRPMPERGADAHLLIGIRSSFIGARDVEGAEAETAASDVVIDEVVHVPTPTFAVGLAAFRAAFSVIDWAGAQPVTDLTSNDDVEHGAADSGKPPAQRGCSSQ